MSAKRGLIFGVIQDAKGRPVPDARVYFTAGPVPMPDIAALTDTRGEFSLAAPASGTYQLQVAADGFEPAAVTVEVPGEKELEIRMKPERGSRGKR